MHLIAYGLDQDFQGTQYYISIPMARVLDPSFEVTLALKQDGEALTIDHGYPLRLIVPGYIGVRNCKWVCRLAIGDEEATSVMQKRDYKMIKESDWSKIDYDKYECIMGNHQNSCISSPESGFKLPKG
mmetsp:Transcript_10106/g.17066  ORF Transcript_10106/g.17066 Transcript_10106/m.17066 type:complete len:128 (-) Transcript_10106:457-840(-)